jgi:hypothetical protein
VAGEYRADGRRGTGEGSVLEQLSAADPPRSIPN